MRKIDEYATSVNCNFAIVVDEHSARTQLLECAAKTMYGHHPTKRLVSPPFEVESHLNQSIQAADWIAAIIGRMWAYRILPDQYRDHQCVEDYYASRIAALATHSTVDRRPPAKPANEPGKPVVIEGVVATTQRTTLRYSVLDRRR